MTSLTPPSTPKNLETFQSNLDSLIRDLDKLLERNEISYQSISRVFGKQFEVLAKDTQFWRCFLKAIITQLGLPSYERLDAAAMWLTFEITAKVAVPELHEFQTIILPYLAPEMRQHLTTTCMVIAIMMTQYDDEQIQVHFTRKLAAFLMHVVMASDCDQAKIYALIAVQPYLDVVGSAKMWVILDQELTQKLGQIAQEARKFEEMDVMEMVGGVVGSRRAQLALLARLTAEKTLGRPPSTLWTTTTIPSSRTYSTSNYLFGSSHCYTLYQFHRPVTPTLCYFEVQLLTIGSFRIGFAQHIDAQDNNNLGNLPAAGDAICVDPYEQGIWANGKEKLWKRAQMMIVGSMVCLMVDYGKREIKFMVDDQKPKVFQTNKQIWKAIKEGNYYFSISLAAFQSCIALGKEWQFKEEAEVSEAEEEEVEVGEIEN